MGTHPIFESDFDCLTELMSSHLLAPIRFNLLVANLLAIAEAFPRLDANVANSVSILAADGEERNSLQTGQALLSIHAAMALVELIGQMTGITFFQYIQSTISIACHTVSLTLLWIYTVYAWPHGLLYITLFVFMAPPFLLEIWLWLFTACYKRTS